MPASDPYPHGVDPVHVWSVCRTAAPAIQDGGAAILIGGRYAARVHLPDRPAARAAHDALRRVGYQADRGVAGGRDLIVAGWSEQGLESRLTAMRGVLHVLAAEPGLTAASALDRLLGLPAAELSRFTGQRLLIHQAGEQLRTWISATSGIHAPCDPRARPTDPGRALRLAATRRAEEAIDDLAQRHIQLTELAVALYPALRQRMDHDTARYFAIQRAAIAFHLSRRIGQDLTPLMRNASQPAQPPVTRPAATRPATTPTPPPTARASRPAAGQRPATRKYPR